MFQMDECNDFVTDECAEVLVRTGTENMSRRNVVEEVEPTSFDMLVRTALALQEGDPRDEHSYAFSDKKIAFDGSKKDHCYSTNSKMAHRKVASLSDENIYQSTLEVALPKHQTDLLPQYQSKDSALDVTGFDTISEKCLSYENIHLKTVDVFTDKCILPGMSDPDISKMTLRSQSSFSKSSSLPNSPPKKEQTLSIDHTYSTKLLRDWNLNSTEILNKCDTHFREQNIQNKSPLFDHSYDTNPKRKSLPCNVGIKRGRSSEVINFNFSQMNLKSSDFTKSPFLDHSYQSVELRCFAKRQVTGKKSLASSDKVYVRMRDEPQPFFHQSLDHTYGQIGDSSSPDECRLRSNSMSSMPPPSMLDLVTDHSYVQTSPSKRSSEEDLTGLSDSGTESFNDDDEEMSEIFGSLVTLQKDHSYVTKKDLALI